MKKYILNDIPFPNNNVRVIVGISIKFFMIKVMPRKEKLFQTIFSKMFKINRIRLIFF